MPELSYPVDIVFETEGESVTTLNSEEELELQNVIVEKNGKKVKIMLETVLRWCCQ